VLSVDEKIVYTKTRLSYNFIYIYFGIDLGIACVMPLHWWLLSLSLLVG